MDGWFLVVCGLGLLLVFVLCAVVGVCYGIAIVHVCLVCGCE